MSRKSRCYDRCFAGLLKCELKNDRVFFLTLTTSPVTVDGLSGKQRLELIQKDFRAFQKRVRRQFGHSVVGIGSKRQVRSIEFFSVRAAEGYGVIHCLHTGCYLPEHWVRRVWNELHGSHIVCEKWIRGGSDRLSRYLVSQYVSNQPQSHTFNPYGFTRGWCVDGFIEKLSHCRRYCKRWYEWCDGSNGFSYHPVDYVRLWSEFRKWLYECLFPQVSLDDSFKTFMSQVREVSGSLYGFRF